jgi:hypothetical protein
MELGKTWVEEFAIFGAAGRHPRQFGPLLAHALNAVNDFGKTSGPSVVSTPRDTCPDVPTTKLWSAPYCFFAFVNGTMTKPGTRSDFANDDGWSKSNKYAALSPSPWDDDDDAGSIVVPRRHVKKATSFDHSFTLSRDFQTMVCTPVVAVSTWLSGQPHCLNSFP